MSRLNAEQRRYIEHGVLIAARTLAFRALRLHFRSVQLSDLVIVNNGQGLKEEERDQEGEYEVFSSSGLIGHHSANLSNDGFVVIGRKGSAGRTTLAPNGGWVIDTAYYAQPIDTQLLDLDYLYFAISSLDFTEDVTATAIPGINRTSLYQHDIPVPPIEVQRSCVELLRAAEQHKVGDLPPLFPPIDEQRRIVARIDALAEQISAARGLRHGAVEEAEAFLSAEQSAIFGTLLRGLTRRLDEIAMLERGKFSFRPRNDPRFFDGDHPWIQIGEIQSSGKYIRSYTATLNDLVVSLSRFWGMGAILLKKEYSR